MTRSLVATGNAAGASASVNVETVAASLLVLAHAGAAQTVTGELTDPATGRSVTVSAPWRARRSVLAAAVGKQMARLGAVTAIRVDHGDGPHVLVTGADVTPSADAALLAGRVDRALGAADNVPVGAIDLHGEEDLRIVAAAHRPGRAPGDSVPALVRAQALARPQATAIEEATRSVSYADLVAAADRYAGVLRAAGVASGDVVAVGLPRRAELVVTLLAVWSLRAAFLPVDPGHPRARLDTLLDTADARFAVLTDPQAVTRPGCRVVAPPDGDPLPAAAPLPVEATSAGDPPTGDDLAYAMSTSGSTGRPKVVGVSHAALAHCVATFADLLAPGTVAGTTALTFDISLLELFLPLATGGRLLLVDDATRRDPARLGGYLSAARPDLIQATPSGWRLLLPHLSGDLAGRTLLCGGEAVTADLAARLVDTGATVWNVYGPTEATIWCTAQRLDRPVPDPVPIGAPLPGTVAVVRGRDGRPVPVGQVGELHVGGPQLAVGYLGDADRTAEVFRDDEYRTGDLCAWRPDGTLSYHGRADNQVKIRGHRIELEEIETYAERHPAVNQAAAVVVSAAEDDQRLVLYVRTGGDGPTVTDAALREHLAASLPTALLPQRIVALPELPLTPSQKVDRRALREAATAHIHRRAGSEETPS
ncbi:amino acid adenylation domain-containing protein [Micromonospora craniellae]|uniref:Amino acid adenylation domain-containing protein n=1 Tax=Micromonospora craniellae TaxID=2294034 RepID=A0A372FYD0_9ACTN|nr:amino acid adenylation domain-containing protein [Micromonospora craniellae]QOC93361.1 amino acid adenylation domain-containing protein [Micromonospora craniellae]RFS45807.1 amino acid adenylation domain-containing protein [Micromonospora craniellae]